MPNKKLAGEWLSLAERNLETAILLNKENHYTDVIAVDIQQAIEKALKAVYAFYGEKIPRTHSLEILVTRVHLLSKRTFYSPAVPPTGRTAGKGKHKKMLSFPGG